MKPVAERIAAKEQGLIRYFTGKPCKNNHVSERFVSDGKCLECNRIKMQKYWDAHPEAVKKRNVEFKQRKFKNPEAYKKDLDAKITRWNSDSEFRLRQIERMKARHEKYKNDPEYLEKTRKQSREWPNKNKGAYLSKLARRRAKLKQAIPIWADKQAILEVYKTCPPGYHVDHVVPLSGKNVCGLHVHWNLQHLPAKENLSKGNKLAVIA
jgi:hypothetical protein